MSDCYIQFSECLTLNSPEECAWFERYMGASTTDSEEHWGGDEFGPLTPEAKFWDPVLGENEEDSACFEYEIFETPRHIWFHVDDHGNVEHVAKLVQRFFQEMRPEGRDGFAISWAETCSKMEAGQFGGGACFVTRDRIHWLNTWQWIDELAQHLRVE